MRSDAKHEVADHLPAQHAVAMFERCIPVGMPEHTGLWM